MPPRGPGVHRRALAPQPQRAQFREKDRVGRGGHLASVRPRPRRLVWEGRPRRLPHRPHERPGEEQENPNPATRCQGDCRRPLAPDPHGATPWGCGTLARNMGVSIAPVYLTDTVALDLTPPATVVGVCIDVTCRIPIRHRTGVAVDDDASATWTHADPRHGTTPMCVPP